MSRPISLRPAPPSADPSLLQHALHDLLLRTAERRVVMIAIDDLHAIDAASAALVAALVPQAGGQDGRGLYATDAEVHAEGALRIVRAHSRPLPLPRVARDRGAAARCVRRGAESGSARRSPAHAERGQAALCMELRSTCSTAA